MASKQTLVVVAATIAFVFLPALALAMDHVVGDGHGWTLGVDYAAWAEGKQFRVGDTIAFKYSNVFHNVAELGGQDFRACNKAAASSIWNSGEDRLTLDRPGRRWFICAVNDHCQRGMKLNVTVLPGTPAPLAAPAPAPAPAQAPRPSRRFLSRW